MDIRDVPVHQLRQVLRDEYRVTVHHYRHCRLQQVLVVRVRYRQRYHSVHLVHVQTPIGNADSRQEFKQTVQHIHGIV